MDWSGLSERNGFRTRAGTLTLLMLANQAEAEAVCDALAQLDAALFDPDTDYDAGDWYAVEWEEDDSWEEEWEEEDERGVRLPVQVRRALHELHYAARALAGWLLSLIHI